MDQRRGFYSGVLADCTNDQAVQFIQYHVVVFRGGSIEICNVQCSILCCMCSNAVNNVPTLKMAAVMVEKIFVQVHCPLREHFRYFELSATAQLNHYRSL